MSKPHSLRIPGLAGELAMQVHAGTDIYISRAIAAEGIWEPSETDFLLSVLAPGQVFVDVGANIGYFSLVAAAAVRPGGAVIAFEPEQENFQLLEENCRLNGLDNVLCCKAALGDADSQGQLYLNEENRGDHSILPGDDSMPTVPIEIVDGSSYIRQHHARVDCIKIDTQGYECQVMAGLHALVAASLPDLVLMIEFSPLHLRKAGASGGELLEQLARLGDIHLYVLDEHSHSVVELSPGQLRALSALTERDPAGEGYTNLIVTGRPLGTGRGWVPLTDWGMYEDALSYLLLSSRMHDWRGDASGAASYDRYFYFPEGWALVEPWGRWSQGKRSRLRFVPAEEMRSLANPQLRVTARYFGDPEATGVHVNGEHLGDFDLREANIALPAESLLGDFVELEFIHQAPLRPCDVSDSDDDREIKLGIESLSIEA
jgi:FkbM family methyltransferase